MEKCLLVDGSFSLFLQRNRHAGALLSAIQVWYDDDRRRESCCCLGSTWRKCLCGDSSQLQRWPPRPAAYVHDRCVAGAEKDHPLSECALCGCYAVWKRIYHVLGQGSLL